MSSLQKQLARFSEECLPIDADRWQLALTNGASLAVTARRDEGFVLLDADPGLCPAAGQLLPLLERSRELPAAVKFALRGSTAFRLRGEFPLPQADDESDGDGADRIREHLDGMRVALHRLHCWISCAAAGSEVACPEPQGDGQAIPGGLIDSLKEAGWKFHHRPGGTMAADLDTGRQFLQAAIEPYAAGTRFCATFYRSEVAGNAAQQALCLYLLQANAALRYARAFFRREGDGIAAGFEVRIESTPSVAEVSHALAALSVAGRECGRELGVFDDAVVAGIYRSARPLFHQQSKGA